MFHFNVCCVNDQTTKKVLFEGAIDGGLHKFNLASTVLLMTKQAIQLSTLKMMSLSSSFVNKDKCNSPSFLPNSTYDVWH